MNVIIEINGREAIPIRAIPFLTDWEMMFPDALVDALAGEGIRNSFTGLVAHRRNGGALKELAARWWLNHVTPDMKALESRIRGKQVSDDECYVEWKLGALEALPASVFVWKDDYVARHERQQKRTGSNELLDFCPDVPPIFESLVANGFDELPTDTAPAKSTGTPSPVDTDQTDAVVPASDAKPDPERRLALLRKLGGTAKYYRCEWAFTGIKALVDTEKANGRKRSTEKTIRADLKEAAQIERDAKNAGFANGLGQR